MMVVGGVTARSYYEQEEVTHDRTMMRVDGWMAEYYSYYYYNNVKFLDCSS